MTKNKFLDDLINRLEEISKIDRGVPSVLFINNNEARELLESDYVKRDELTADDIPQPIIDSIYEDGERAGYEQGSFAGEKVTVPAYVARFIENNYDVPDIIEALYVVDKGELSLNDTEFRVHQWLNNNDTNKRKLLDAVVNDHEVEEDEKLYRIYEPTTQRFLTFAGGQYVWFLSKQENVKQQFTEQEIKNLDERL
jgi:hypothetical protein